MARIEDIAERYGRHIGTPWQRTVAGAQRVVMVVYDKELERTLRARKLGFETATREAVHDWVEIDLAPAFAEWMAADDYCEYKAPVRLMHHLAHRSKATDRVPAHETVDPKKLLVGETE